MDPGIPIRESPVGPVTDRTVALVLLGVALGFVVVLTSVDPDPRGHGTHEMLGMAACGWPLSYGIPCPTCGVTTAATHLVHLSPWRAVSTHPFGAALAIVGLWLAVLASSSLLRRRSFIARILNLPYGAILAALFVLLLASWMYRWLTWDV